MIPIKISFFPGNFRASASISFDFETSAQSPPTTCLGRFKTAILKSGNTLGMIHRDLASRNGRGSANRKGVEKILGLFRELNIHGTWFSTGHVLMKGNRNHCKYQTNIQLSYATKEAGFTDVTTWRQNKKSFCHEPFSDYYHHPHYYLGDLAEKMHKGNEDIQCHSFSHPYIAMELPENIRIDLEEWKNTSTNNGFTTSTIFAFPFLGDYYIKWNNKKYTPNKAIGKGKAVYLSENQIKVFEELSFELFTRCGSMNDDELFTGFKPYRSSPIYCMKDKGILSFDSIDNFSIFLDQMVEKNATIDFWLHPNDVVDNKNAFVNFSKMIKLLHSKHTNSIIWLATIKEQWERYKHVKEIDFFIEENGSKYILTVRNKSLQKINQLAFQIEEDYIINQKNIQMTDGRLIIDSIEGNSQVIIELQK